MPFKQPWRNFAEGDLVYGIENRRQGRRPFITKHGTNPQDGVYTIDDYPVLKLESGIKDASLIDTLLSHGKYYTAVGGNYDENSPNRRKCKGGLYWATMVERKHVHFVLDGLDLKAVVNKSFTGKNPDIPEGVDGEQKNRSITGSELRWIYRNREHENVQNYIQFWTNDTQCEPPWVTDVELWSQYIPTKSVNIHGQNELDIIAEPSGNDKKKKKKICIVQ